MLIHDAGKLDDGRVTSSLPANGNAEGNPHFLFVPLNRQTAIPEPIGANSFLQLRVVSSQMNCRFQQSIKVLHPESEGEGPISLLRSGALGGSRRFKLYSFAWPSLNRKTSAKLQVASGFGSNGPPDLTTDQR